jgi:hypothetical protein
VTDLKDAILVADPIAQIRMARAEARNSLSQNPERLFNKTHVARERTIDPELCRLADPSILLGNMSWGVGRTWKFSWRLARYPTIGFVCRDVVIPPLLVLDRRIESARLRKRERGVRKL